ncbi:hypothetical protein B0H14DRAFT_2346080 [Mycena olivaceomarginata]|nr:hypothetical protein B0H14DRAFT_2346080 [Mycena olivaceomarginata]
MAQMARDYHNSIQERDCPDEYGRIMATELVLEKCNVCLSEFNVMENDLSTDDVAEALKLSNNGKAPGVDGIPYEFYKMLDILFQESKDYDHKKFDILGFLTELYNDVEKYGIAQGSQFNTGWLAPLFKKGDRSLISTIPPLHLGHTSNSDK